MRNSWNNLQRVKGDIVFSTRLNLTSHTPIVIYQMGKVGSSSVTESLQLAGVNLVFHVHRMNPDNIQRVRKEYLDHNQRPLNEKVGERLYRSIVERRRKAKFITLVREPIGRNISAFFQNLRRFSGAECGDADYTVEELVDIFIRDYQHAVPLTWFDVEMKQTLQIDVYEYPFSKEKGYLSIKRGNFELLILKLELDDSTKEKAIAEFLGWKNFRLITSNVARDKKYSETYSDFLRKIKLPKSYVEIMCNSAYTRHFYSDAEIEQIRSKWLKRARKEELPTAVYSALLSASSREVLADQ